ncbi:hypothetical protein BESB_082910 [Besnoitia besnoiti]|uniref:Suppressor of forked domain-containing protein n=1 Tax=Besnoitia besnoiti TaxID=94643 RepID=A0A2A9MCI0_BESBE|nr:hypothetical protein BESB_082910 [Besnoitia besnoiti]PFH33092.1 hypothetical protein BESB_082910 [Besnoitia besnoiti]
MWVPAGGGAPGGAGLLSPLSRDERAPGAARAPAKDAGNPDARGEKKKEKDMPMERASVLQLFFISLDGVFAAPPPLPAKRGAAEKGSARKQKSVKADEGDVRMDEEDEDSGDQTRAAGKQGQASATGNEEVDRDDQVASMALEARLQLNPFDADAWDALLEANESAEIYERVLASFPTSANYWRRYAESLYSSGQIHAASAVYKRCIHACPHLDLWLSYLRFLYRVGSLHDFLQNLRRAVEKVGFDRRSGSLWMELLALYIRVHNTLLLLKGNTQGLLAAPNVPGSNASGLSATPLLASEEEQRSFCRPLSAAAGSLAEKLADVNILRTAFQQCLCTAIDGLDGVWAAYCAFERSVGVSNTQLAAKLTAEAGLHYDASKHAYQEIVALAKDIDPLMLAVPLHEAAKAQQPQLEAWRALLRFEKRNPLRLQATPLLRRLTHLFQSCLLSCAFVADFWIDFFQLLLAHNHRHKAVDVMRRAIEQFLPDDELLHLVLADFLESRRLVNAADAVYRAALALQAQLRANPSQLSQLLPEASPQGETPAGVASAVMLIRYLDFVRRSHGETAWRASFYEIAKLQQDCPWEVFLAYAEAEWRIYRSEANALRALRIAFPRFRLHPHFIVAYVDFLVSISRLDAARELFRVSVYTLQRERGTGSSLLWRKWIRLELRYGDMATLQAVIDLRAQQRAQLPLEDPSLLESQAGLGVSAAALDAPDAAIRERAEVAVLCSRNALARSGGGRDKADAGGVEREDLARAKVAVRRRQFMGGDSLNEIADCYQMMGHLAPRSSLLRLFLAEVEDADAEDVFAAVLGEDDEGRGEACFEDTEDDECRRDGERSQATRRKTARSGKARKDGAASGRAPQEQHGKTDLEGVAEPSGSPEASGGASGAGYASKLLAETAKRKFAEMAPEKPEAEAFDGPPVDPPKALCDLIALLPKNDMRNFVDADLVEYTMAALNGLGLPEVPESERVPIPVKDLLALRHTQLQCFRAMQIQQQQQQAALQRGPKLSSGSGSGTDGPGAGPTAEEEQDSDSRGGPSPSPFPDRRSSSRPRPLFGERRRGEAGPDGRGGPPRRSGDILSAALSDISSGDDEDPHAADLELFEGAAEGLVPPAYLHQFHPHLHPPGHAPVAGGPATPWAVAHAAGGLLPPAAAGAPPPHVAAGVRAAAGGSAYPLPHQQLVYPAQEVFVGPAPGALPARGVPGGEAVVAGALGPPVFPVGGAVPHGWMLPGGPPPAALHGPPLGALPAAVPYGHVYPHMHPLPGPAALGPRIDVPPGWPAVPGFLGGLFGGAGLPKATRRRAEAE